MKKFIYRSSSPLYLLINLSTKYSLSAVSFFKNIFLKIFIFFNLFYFMLRSDGKIIFFFSNLMDFFWNKKELFESLKIFKCSGELFNINESKQRLLDFLQLSKFFFLLLFAFFLQYIFFSFFFFFFVWISTFLFFLFGCFFMKFNELENVKDIIDINYLKKNKISESERISRAMSIVKEAKIKSKYFKRAFTHVSYLNEKEEKENDNIYSYETLEFLGDSIINYFVTLYIFERFKEDYSYSEGKMSKLKQLMIREETLSHLSKEIELSDYLLLGSGEKRNNGLKNNSILADIFESFVASLFLSTNDFSHSYKIVNEFLNLTVFHWIEGKENMIWDYKSKVQEYCQAKKIKFGYSFFEINEENPPKRIFISKLRLDFDNGFFLEEEGSGKNKRESEQFAAKKILEIIEKKDFGKDKNY